MSNTLNPLKLVNEDLRNQTAPAVETLLKQNYPLYNLFIQFPTAPSLEGPGGDIFKALTFMAYISSPISDTYSPSYQDMGPVFGRMDAVPVYSRTTRTIKVDFSIPAYDIEDARRIRGKLDIVAKNCYPTYTKKSVNNPRLTIHKPPLIKIKFGNIICNPTNQFEGLLGYLSSGVTIAHDLSGGVFTEWPGQEIYAKKYNLSLSMNVLHQFTPGFVREEADNNFLRSSAILSFPGAYIKTEGQSKGQFQTIAEQYTDVGKSDRIKLAEAALSLGGDINSSQAIGSTLGG